MKCLDLSNSEKLKNHIDSLKINKAIEKSPQGLLATNFKLYIFNRTTLIGDCNFQHRSI